MSELVGLPGDEESVEVGPVVFTFYDIKTVVDVFYTRVPQDSLLSVPFQSVNDWTHHIERLTHFWWIRFGGEPYLSGVYDPVGKHYLAGFNRELLDRWRGLFGSVVSEVLTEDKAKVWALIVERMGEALAMRNDYMVRDNRSE